MVFEPYDSPVMLEILYPFNRGGCWILVLKTEKQFPSHPVRLPNLLCISPEDVVSHFRIKEEKASISICVQELLPSSS